MTGPLAGLKVVELTHVMAGPTCTLMLADMGADVIKVEKTPDGDDTRSSVPPKVGDEAAAFLMMNRNKRGIALDLKTPGGAQGAAAADRRAPTCWSRTSRPARWSAWASATSDLRKDHPGLIYCSLSGFGRTGPYRTGAASISSRRR